MPYTAPPTLSTRWRCPPLRVRDVAANTFGRPRSLGPFIMACNKKTLRKCVRGAAAHTSCCPLSLGIWPATKKSPRIGAGRGGPFFCLLAVAWTIFVAGDEKTPRDVRAGYGSRYF